MKKWIFFFIGYALISSCSVLSKNKKVVENFGRFIQQQGENVRVASLLIQQFLKKLFQPHIFFEKSVILLEKCQ